MSAPIEPGTLLAGKYRVDGVLGQGGMGIVVAAHHVHLDEAVALKFLLPHALTNPDAVARFGQEARASVKIKSEHVARVSDVGTLENGAPYIVMERLFGSDLGAILAKRGPLPVDEAVDYVLQASEAVAEAHALGIVHRDLKPSNLYVVTRADGSPCVKVLDFGISKMLGPGGVSSSSGLTQSSVAMGSPHYMSPEQLTSARDVDGRTDVWALGAILYEFLTGRPPFRAESFAELCTKVLMTRPEPIGSSNPSVPPALDETILAALERDRGRRIQNVAELAQRIVSFAPRHSRLSADRISRILQTAGLSGTAVASPPSTEPAPAPSALTEPALAAPSRTTPSLPHSVEASVGTGSASVRDATLQSVPLERPPDSQTMDGLGQTMAKKRGSRLWLVALAGGVVTAGALVIVRARSPVPAISSGAETAAPVVESLRPEVAAPPPAPPARAPAAPIVEPVMEAMPVQVASAAPSAASAAPAPSATMAARPPFPGRLRIPAHASSSGPPVSSPAKASTKPNCDPNYYFDKQGEKHFKPQCF
jgi:serine/threonine-protein kinase